MKSRQECSEEFNYCLLSLLGTGALLLSLALLSEVSMFGVGGFFWWFFFPLVIKSYSCSALHCGDRHYASTLIL